MSTELEEGVLQILPLFKKQFIEMASELTLNDVKEIEFIDSKTISSKGRGGTLLVSDVSFRVILDEETFFPMSKKIAIKFAKDLKAAIKEMKNSFLLENRYSGHPMFGTPRILFASTNDPIILLYEGIEGYNYDECDFIPDKAYYAGKLLGIFHGAMVQPVDDVLYQNYVRKVVQYFATTGKERELSLLMGQAFEKVKGLQSGAVIHSDFHQSNVMLSTSKDRRELFKVYVIDPEFMSSGHYDRLEDFGIFFGNQALQEYTRTKSISNTLADMKSFLVGYEEFLKTQGLSLKQIYERGLPIAFFISLWVLLDSLDFVLNRTEGTTLVHPEVLSRLEFAVFILTDEKLEQFSMMKFL